MNIFYDYSFETICLTFVKTFRFLSNSSKSKLYDNSNGEKIIPTIPNKSPKKVNAINKAIGCSRIHLEKR